MTVTNGSKKILNKSNFYPTSQKNSVMLQVSGKFSMLIHDQMEVNNSNPE